MSKKYLLWIVLAVIFIVTIFLFVARGTKAPSEQVQPGGTNRTTNPGEKVPAEINLEDPAVDFEGDAADLDVSEEILEDFDSEDFDAETIDEDAF